MMFTIFRLGILIVFLVVLIRLKLNLALALIITSVCAGILFRVKLLVLIKTFPLTLIQATTLEFLFIIYLVLLLGSLMELSGNLRKIINSMEGLFGDYRIGVAIMPALIGLLPMPAGAMLSAPIVKQAGIKANLSPDKMTYINFWFRHLWEYFWPLYPAILISAGIFNVSVREIMIAQFPLSLFAITVGLFFIFRLPRISNDPSTTNINHLWQILYNLWPIILVILLVLILKFRMSLAMTIGGFAALLFSGMNIKQIPLVFKKAFSISTLGVIYSVFLFKNIVEISGSLKMMPGISSGPFILKMLIIFFAPFIVGFLTGVNSAFAGIGFPVIAPLIVHSGANLSYIMFAYASGFAGVLLSPVHLCLCLTKEYYGAEYPKIYRYLLPSVIFVFAGAILLLCIYKL